MVNSGVCGDCLHLTFFGKLQNFYITECNFYSWVYTLYTWLIRRLKKLMFNHLWSSQMQCQWKVVMKIATHKLKASKYPSPFHSALSTFFPLNLRASLLTRLRVHGWERACWPSFLLISISAKSPTLMICQSSPRTRWGFPAIMSWASMLTTMHPIAEAELSAKTRFSYDINTLFQRQLSRNKDLFSLNNYTTISRIKVNSSVGKSDSCDR